MTETTGVIDNGNDFGLNAEKRDVVAIAALHIIDDMREALLYQFDDAIALRPGADAPGAPADRQPADRRGLAIGRRRRDRDPIVAIDVPRFLRMRAAAEIDDVVAVNEADDRRLRKSVRAIGGDRDVLRIFENGEDDLPGLGVHRDCHRRTLPRFRAPA